MVNVFVKSVFDEVPFSPAQISESTREFQENHIALDKLMVSLVEQYPSQWAGMSKSGLQIEPTFSELLSKMIGETNAAVRYLKCSPEHKVTYSVTVASDRHQYH